MKIKHAEMLWLDEGGVYSASNIVEISGLSSEELDELVGIGVMGPIDRNAETMTFQMRHVVIANTARRLKNDFDLDLHGMALAMTLMQRIDELKNELLLARAR